MGITELSIRRPTAIVMAVALFIGLGLMGYFSLGADLFPSVNIPVISVHSTYVGAGAEEIEKDVVKPIENAVSSISGIDDMRSFAGEGYGYTVLMFKMDTDINAAVIDVQKALDSIAQKLPKDASRPVMSIHDMNADPVLTLTVSGAATSEELYHEADRIKQALERLPGVGSVTLEGAQKKELAVRIDKTALDYYGISLNTVLGKLLAENMNIPAGQIKQTARDQTVRVIGEFQNLGEARNLHIPLAGGGSVRLADIAAVELAYPDKDQEIRLNNQTTIGILVRKQSDANIVATANGVKNELEGLKKTLATGVTLGIANDATEFIHSSLTETKRNLVEGILTTAFVLFLFLRRWRSSLIVLVAIPTSLISTFFFMWLFKFTFNTLSLMALALCIGILVDDSIVILENIHRHMQLGKDPIRAAIDGRTEIGMAAVAITLCDVVVFAPIAFMGGLVGQFFKEFGLTVVFATLFSLIVSFTVTPMLAARVFAGVEGRMPESGAKGQPGRLDRVFGAFRDWYNGILIWSMQNRRKVVAGVLAALLLSVALIPLRLVGTEFLPTFDHGRLDLSLTLTPGSNLAQTDQKTREVEQYLQSLTEVKDFLTIVGGENNAAASSINVTLVDQGQRRQSASQLARQIRSWGKQLPGVDFSVTEPSLVGRTSMDSSKPLALNLTGADMDILKQFARVVEDIVRSVPGVVDVDNTLRASQPEIRVRIDRLAAAEYGVSVADIAASLRTAIAGSKAGVYRQGGDEYDVVVKFADKQLQTPYDIGSVKVTNPLGQQFFLSQMASVELADSPQELQRLNREHVITISANLQGRSLGEINSDIQQRLKAVHLPYGYAIRSGGDQEMMTTSFSSLIKALIASVVLIYMVLVVLYESYLTPLIRMLSLPCGLIGALLALAITGKSLNLISLIGLVMLDGLASKNGTLLIDYAQTLMKRGLPLREALLEAGTTRLRPIIMTSVTMIVGMLPLALALGEGSELKSGMAVALIGGLITSTILSPILLPVVYTIMDDLGKKMARRRRPETGVRADA